MRRGIGVVILVAALGCGGGDRGAAGGGGDAAWQDAELGASDAGARVVVDDGGPRSGDGGAAHTGGAGAVGFDADAADAADVADTANAPDTADAVDVADSGVALPVAPAIVVDEGTAVAPQTRLHLRAPDAIGPHPVTAVSWTVEQPAGSVSLLVPSAAHPEPTFEPNVVGTYTFRLEARDATGAWTTVEPLAVVVTPDAALHVELLWETPADPDPSDEGPEAGADLDLHFVHPKASGPDIDGDGGPDGWFDQPFDCFWFNAAPAWGDADPSAGDDPTLDRDDTDGAGPENLNLQAPEDGASYRIGVHYWHDHEYGPSYATLRVFVYGALVWERTGVELLNHQLWDAATVTWPGGIVVPVVGADGGDQIVEGAKWMCFMGPCP